MSNEFILTQKTHDQITSLLDQVIEVSIWQDAEAKSKDPVKNQGDSFITNKLKIIRETLKNDTK
jgi:hypothetical protein|tara:strand:+ start:1627 stop:1818 length:192 start_codon:yes stop_codon:yes gene_type:complete